MLTMNTTEHRTPQQCSHRKWRWVPKDRNLSKVICALLNEKPGFRGCPWENSFPRVSPTGTAGKWVHFWKYCSWAVRQLLLILYAVRSGPTVMESSAKPKKDRWKNVSGSNCSIYLGSYTGRSDSKSPFFPSFQPCCRLPDSSSYDLSPCGCD